MNPTYYLEETVAVNKWVNNDIASLYVPFVRYNYNIRDDTVRKTQAAHEICQFMENRGLGVVDRVDLKLRMGTNRPHYIGYIHMRSWNMEKEQVRRILDCLNDQGTAYLVYDPSMQHYWAIKKNTYEYPPRRTHHETTTPVEQEPPVRYGRKLRLNLTA